MYITCTFKSSQLRTLSLSLSLTHTCTHTHTHAYTHTHTHTHTHTFRYNSTGLDPWEGGGASPGPGSAQRMSVDQIRAEQQQIIDEQDKGLDALSKALRRQQQMGLDMQDEITEHNGMAVHMSLTTLSIA